MSMNNISYLLLCVYISGALVAIGIASTDALIWVRLVNGGVEASLTFHSVLTLYHLSVGSSLLPSYSRMFRMVSKIVLLFPLEDACDDQKSYRVLP